MIELNDLPKAVPIDKPLSNGDDFDWNTEFAANSKNHYTEYWDDSKSYFDNVRSLHDRCIWHGENQEIISHIASTYACAHSLPMQFAPILFFCGVSGSAKSESGKLIASIREKTDNIIGAECTFASIRNILNATRWYVYSEFAPDYSLNNERPSLLVWADIKEQNLAEERKIYSLLRNGCDRKEDRLLIAGEAGENKEFRVFSLKIASSVEPFYEYPRWSELKRRILLIKTRVLDNSPSAINFRANQLEADKLDFTGCDKHFSHFWDRANILKLAHHMKQSKAKALMLRAGFSEHECKSSYDLLLQHAVLNNCSVSDSIDIWLQYWKLARTWLEVSGFNLETVLKDLITDYEHTRIADGIPLYVEHSKCVAACKDVSIIANSKDIAAYMLSRGYQPLKKNGKQYWMEVL